jgi:malate dehydrogenase
VYWYKKILFNAIKLLGVLMNKGKRVGIVGAGNVGSTVAYSLAMLGSAHEVILRDNKIDIAKGKALDMSQAASAIRSHTVVSVA